MRKAFNKNENPIPVILPIEEIIDEEDFEEEEEIVPKVRFNQKEVFKEIDEPVEEPVEETKEPVEIIETIDEANNIKLEIKPKRKRGQRGKDKKPRTKKPLTEKQLASLARAREKSRQVRQAKKIEKERLKKEAILKAAENIKKTRKIKKHPLPQKPPPPPPRNIPKPRYEDFFAMMDKYEEYKEKKRKIKQIKPQSQPHPANRTFQKPPRPTQAPAPNPFDVCFQYNTHKRRSNPWGY